MDVLETATKQGFNSGAVEETEDEGFELVEVFPVQQENPSEELPHCPQWRRGAWSEYGSWTRCSGAFFS